MGIKISSIDNVSESTKVAIKRKSAQNLPNNPSEKGYSAEEIKRRFYQPILDAANSAIAEIDRVVNDVNDRLAEIGVGINDYIDTTDIKEPYKVKFNENNWVYNNELLLFECKVSVDEHEIENYEDIGVDMFLIDENGNYIQVNQFVVSLNGDVRFYHESSSAGYANIYVKREGLISSGKIVDVNNITGLAKVALTNNFEDLDNVPDLNLAKRNEITIAEILDGTKIVEKAKSAEMSTIAESATYATSSGSSNNSIFANNATKAQQDDSGNVIVKTYAKQNGSYPGMAVGNANRATQDADGNNFVDTYAKKDGTYLDMIVGYSRTAAQDVNGNNIYATYAKKDGTYENMIVGKSYNANVAESSNKLNGQDSNYYLNYDNLYNKPQIPSDNIELNNGAGYISSGQITSGDANWGVKLSNGLIINWGANIIPTTNGIKVNFAIPFTRTDYVVAGSANQINNKQIRAMAATEQHINYFMLYGQYSEDNSGLTGNDVPYSWIAIGQ